MKLPILHYRPSLICLSWLLSANRASTCELYLNTRRKGNMVRLKAHMAIEVINSILSCITQVSFSGLYNLGAFIIAGQTHLLCQNS